MRTAVEQPATLPRHAALVLCLVAHRRRCRRDDRIDGVEAGRDRGGRFPLAAPIAEGERHVVQFAFGQLFTVAVKRPAGVGDLTGERIAEQRLLVVLGIVLIIGWWWGKRFANQPKLSLARKRPGVSQPQTANAGVQVAGAGQLSRPATQRSHQPPIGIDTEKAAGRQHGNHDADERTAEQQLVANGASLDHV